MSNLSSLLVGSREAPPPASASAGQYIYAIADAAHPPIEEVTGIDGARVRSLSSGVVTAYISNCWREKIRPERAHLAAHQQVLHRLMLDFTVLPMAFGIIADDREAVRTFLDLNQSAFDEQLARVAGRVEMGLRAVWDVPNIFEYFLDLHPELRTVRDRLLGQNREPRHEEKLELGRFFDQLLQEDREAHAATLEEVLSPCCEEIKRLPLHQVQEVANLSLLVERDRQTGLDDAILAAAGRFDNNYAFDVNGPWAPHNFVEMNLELKTLQPNRY